MADTFTLVIGAKRQVTFPARLLELLSLKEGNEIEISVEDGQISLVPMVRVPRHFVSPALLERMEARRGAKPSDMSLGDFETWLAASTKAAAKQASDPAERQPAGSHAKVKAGVGGKAAARTRSKVAV
jgi:AbrB family looped-hinge helix DNA binding protein